MKTEICHFRIAQRRIIGEGLSFLRLEIDSLVKRTVDDMDLSPRLQLGQRMMNDLFQVREILDGVGKYDAVEPPVLQYSRADVPVYEMQVGIVVEDPGRLLQFREIDIQAGDFCAGDLRHLVGEPAIAATYFQDIEIPVLIPQVVDEAGPGSSPRLPFPVMGVAGGDIGQLHQL